MVAVTEMEATADRLLAEFLADEGIVQRLKPRKAVGKAVRSMPIEKAEYQPDNSEIGCQSKGIQACWTDTDTLAAIWVYEWHMEHIAYRETQVRVSTGAYSVPQFRYQLSAPLILSVPYVIVREGIRESESVGRYVHAVEVDADCGLARAVAARQPQSIRSFNSVNNNPIAARLECEQWKTKRTPRQGQRPSVTAR